ncbi:SDR family oxidoreductase [Yimella sp. cx-51]|uniref:SDR family oxidoreductase n=1 Tax=Yimella sp. cx-51 TaxID=2770551 RepID=UPI00165EA36D|nr:SDR family NAD(P)-dependent oxidoreductase [Yimella sp. cx-51]MBC9955829.1 SDR family NAD(P)-dependent oxidoreductase [Yimella sp. cx-51]MBD2757992.1 SDR family NAD(P)-dependent oxidoreductase [Yimella sp. cx-573]QTH37620.1 SDR family NAD(P)-dependent oxidoreductase [Yimella sp. cx-51]
MLPDGAVVAVTGAGGALGEVVSRLLVDAGVTVIAVDRDLDLLSPTAERYVPMAVDLLDASAADAWAGEVLAGYGRIDGLVHLVGGWRGGKGIVEADLADWDALHDSLIRTLQHTSRAVHDPLRESPDGRLVIISSTGVAAPTAKNAAYVAAKAATEAWTLAVADSFKGSGAAAVVLRVMALLTPAMREAKPEAKFRGFTPVDKVAAAVVALWDDPADSVNGRIIDLTVDPG